MVPSLVEQANRVVVIAAAVAAVAAAIHVVELTVIGSGQMRS